jgi:hypothetical protein
MSKTKPGGTSKTYFGIHRVFSPEWFHATSSGLDKNRGHNVIKPIRRHTEIRQRDLRKKLSVAAHEMGFNTDQWRAEWDKIRNNASKLATDYFNAASSDAGVIPYTLANIQAAENAADEGMEHIEKEVKRRLRSSANWNTHPQLDLAMCDVAQKLVYLRTNNIRQGNKTKYKIGDTTNKSGRDSTYQTHSGGAVTCIWEHPATEWLTENSLREYIRHIGGEQISMDWFWLTREQAAMVSDPASIQSELYTLHL